MMSSSDLPYLVGFARMWGDQEQRIYLGLDTNVLKGYDDMDLAKLLESWTEEYLCEQKKHNGPEDFFKKKVKALCEEDAKVRKMDGEWEKSHRQNNQRAILVERDYKGEYERFALTPAEFKKQYPEEFQDCFPITKPVSLTISPMIHLWIRPCCVHDADWDKFFSDMEDGLPESNIKSGNLATIRLDLFGELKYEISPGTYVYANSHTGQSEGALLVEWAKEMEAKK